MIQRKDAAAYGHLGGQIGGALGGRSTTTAKRRTARANGKKGGRPMESKPCRKCERPTMERDASRRPDCGC